MTGDHNARLLRQFLNHGRRISPDDPELHVWRLAPDKRQDVRDKPNRCVSIWKVTDVTGERDHVGFATIRDKGVVGVHTIGRHMDAVVRTQRLTILWGGNDGLIVVQQ
jgi:hypothetical protein